MALALLVLLIFFLIQYLPFIAVITCRSQNDNLLVKSVHTTQYGIRSHRYTGTNLWNYLSIDVKKTRPFSNFRQNITNSMIDGYNTVINSGSFIIILSLTTI